MVLILGILVAVPVGLLVLSSFRHVGLGELGFRFSDLTLLNYIQAYSNPKTYTMLANSLWFALGSMLVAMILGGVLAFLSESTDLRFRELIHGMGGGDQHEYTCFLLDRGRFAANGPGPHGSSFSQRGFNVENTTPGYATFTHARAGGSSIALVHPGS
jgi:hypothetical protein